MEAMNHHALEDAKLYKASLHGDVDALNHLIKQDSLVLTRITPTFFKETPLHIAVLNGHTNYAKELLDHRPPLAGEVDAWGHTALHLASAKGYVETVKVLVEADCSGCLKQNSEGRLPLHLAIMKRHVGVVRELVRAHPQAARQTVVGGQNAAHLCVMGNFLEGLKAIVEMIHDDEFLASVDEDGNTILHLAASCRHLRMVEYIIPIMSGGDVANATNKYGLTALDMAENKSMPIRDVQKDLELEVKKILIKAGIPRADVDEYHNNDDDDDDDDDDDGQKRSITRMIIHRIKEFNESFFDHDEAWVKDMRGWLMVIAILAATVAFQAGIQPPGGVWQDNHLDTKTGFVHGAGSAMAADDNFFTYNTLAFLSSMSVILLLVSGYPLHKSKLCVWILMLFIWATLTFTTLTYSATMMIIDAPKYVNGTFQLLTDNATNHINGTLYNSPNTATFSAYANQTVYASNGSTVNIINGTQYTAAPVIIRVNDTDETLSRVLYLRGRNYALPVLIWLMVMGVLLLHQSVIMLVWLAQKLSTFMLKYRSIPK